MQLAIGLLAGTGTTVSFVPQVIKVWRQKSVQDLSPYMLLIHFSGVTLWVVYGLLSKDYVIVLFNVVTLILCFSILVAFLRFNGSAPS